MNDTMKEQIDVVCSNLSTVMAKKKPENCVSNDLVHYDALIFSGQKAPHLSEDNWN